MTRRHLVISGTGRCGTSFLVRLLAAAGLDTGTFPPDHWHPEVRAGWERRFDPSDPSLPYVVKDPWLWTYVDAVDPAAVDALVVPVRDLAGVASSRLRNEWRGVPIEFAGTATYGRVPGGAIYDLTLRSQEHMAARSFYALVHWATVNDVPLVLLSFDAMFADPDYIADRLTLLPRDVRDGIQRHWPAVIEATKARVA